MKELYDKEKELLKEGVPRTGLDLAHNYMWETNITSDKEYEDALKLYDYVLDTEPKSPRQEKIKNKTLHIMDEKLTGHLLAKMDAQLSNPIEEDDDDEDEETPRKTLSNKLGTFLITIGTRLEKNGLRL